MRAFYASARRIAILIGGTLLLLTGVVMLVLPGPGVALIVAGLAVLGTQFEWARRASAWIRDRARDAFAAVKATVQRSP